MGKLERHLENVVKPTWNFAGRIQDETGHWCNAALGLAGEAGEVADHVKKMQFHSERNLQRTDELKSELGDVIYYWLRLVSMAGFSVNEVLAANRKKLEGRHPVLGKVEKHYDAGVQVKMPSVSPEEHAEEAEKEAVGYGKGQR